MTRIRNGETRKENSENLESRRPAYWSMSEMRKERRTTLSLQKGSVGSVSHV